MPDVLENRQRGQCGTFCVQGGNGPDLIGAYVGI